MFRHNLFYHRHPLRSPERQIMCPPYIPVSYILILLAALATANLASASGSSAFVVQDAGTTCDGHSISTSQRRDAFGAFKLPRVSIQIRQSAIPKRTPANTLLFNGNAVPSSEVTDEGSIDFTLIANHTFRLPSSDDLETIQERQLFHPLKPSQVFCVSSGLCRHGHPQAFGFHPTNGPKLVSGLFRLSCPLLCQAIDEYEGEGGVRQMSDWLRSKDRDRDEGWKREGYEKANAAQKNIRMELAKDDKDKLVSRMGDYNAQKFLDSGVAGIPQDQTFNVKCVHAHVADHLCRCPSSTSDAKTNDGITEYDEDGNIIGKHALRILEERGVPVLGNDVCWQQCNKIHQRQPSDWKYVPKKNRQRLRSTRLRRKELQDGAE